MNPFRVDWKPEAEEELARTWLKSTNQQLVTTAQARADHEDRNEKNYQIPL